MVEMSDFLLRIAELIQVLLWTQSDTPHRSTRNIDFTPPTLCPLTPEPDVKKYFWKYFSLSAPICTWPVKFQLSDTIEPWWGPLLRNSSKNNESIVQIDCLEVEVLISMIPAEEESDNDIVICD